MLVRNTRGMFKYIYLKFNSVYLSFVSKKTISISEKRTDLV